VTPTSRSTGELPVKLLQHREAERIVGAPEARDDSTGSCREEWPYEVGDPSCPYTLRFPYRTPGETKRCRVPPELGWRIRAHRISWLTPSRDRGATGWFFTVAALLPVAWLVAFALLVLRPRAIMGHWPDSSSVGGTVTIVLGGTVVIIYFIECRLRSLSPSRSPLLRSARGCESLVSKTGTSTSDFSASF
jgi:hypothetical protein